MKLNVYSLNGVQIDSKESWLDSDLSGNKPYLAADTTPAGYVDISSIVNWDKYGAMTLKDYKVIRVEIATLAATTGWVNLTLEEKKFININEPTIYTD